jgi:phosphatidylglycerol---prolipoprotein diacylglyceryl transferase
MLINDPLLAEATWCGAILAGTAYAITRSRPSLNPRGFYWCSVSALVGGFVGSLLWGFGDYGITTTGFNPLAQGKSFLGGLFGGTLAAVVYLRLNRVSVGAYGDDLITGLALGYGIGRIGCFFNGCDYGIRTHLPWGHSYPPGTEAYADHLSRGWITDQALASLPVHPVQLYAAACGLAIFFILLASKPRWPGAKVSLFAVLYGIYRFLIEFLRGDFRSLAFGLSLPQVVSILLIVAGCAMRLWRRRLNSVSESSTEVARIVEISTSTVEAR